MNFITLKKSAGRLQGVQEYSSSPEWINGTYLINIRSAKHYYAPWPHTNCQNMRVPEGFSKSAINLQGIKKSQYDELGITNSKENVKM